MMNAVENSSLGNVSDVDNNQKNNISFLSSKAIILMIIVLVITIIIFFDNFITSMDWYSKLRFTAAFSGNQGAIDVLNNFRDMIIVLNWILVLIILIVSIIFRISDKKEKKLYSIYDWYIAAGVLHIVLGTVGLTPMIYAISTLVYAIKDRIIKKQNQLSTKANTFISAFSILLIASIIITFVLMQDLF